GCCGFPAKCRANAPTRSNASTSPILNAAPFVFPVRLAAHLIAPSAIPAPNAWSEISRRGRSWARGWPHATGWGALRGGPGDVRTRPAGRFAWRRTANRWRHTERRTLHHQYRDDGYG